MKKQSILLSVLVCLSFQLFAQLKLDVEFGSNFSNSKFTSAGFISANETANRLGYYVGIVPRIEISERLSLSTSLQYSEEGFKYKNSEEIFRFRYIRLIPELELNIINGLNVFGGLSFGYLLDEDVKVNNVWFDTEATFIDDIDYGLAFGAKFRISRFLFSARYNLGIKDINRIDYSNINGSLEQQNRTLQLGVGIRLIK